VHLSKECGRARAASCTSEASEAMRVAREAMEIRRLRRKEDKSRGKLSNGPEFSSERHRHNKCGNPVQVRLPGPDKSWFHSRSRRVIRARWDLETETGHGLRLVKENHYLNATVAWPWQW
jgi:hypothetical protein